MSGEAGGIVVSKLNMFIEEERIFVEEVSSIGESWCPTYAIISSFNSGKTIVLHFYPVEWKKWYIQ